MLSEESIQKIYAPLIREFAIALNGVDVTGVQAPHIPIAQKNYDRSKYRFAFIGMETRGWGSMDEFLSIAKKVPEQAAIEYSKWLCAEGVIKHRGSATFFGFVINFLSSFYHVDHNALVNSSKYRHLLTSYVWGNVNSIERFHVRAKSSGASYESWHAAKKASSLLDSLENIIESTHPKVVIITYKYVDNNYILGNSYTQEVHRKRLDETCRYQYQYLPQHDTHVFILPHPTWIGRYGGGHKKYIDSIINQLQAMKVWDSFPESPDDWE